MEKPVSKRLKFIGSLFPAFFLVHITYISCDGLRSFNGKADVAIVLGNAVHADSSLSPVLHGRVNKALELYLAGRVGTIFVSGGPGDEGVREGDAMKSWLIKHHVPSNVIIADNEGKNTYYTAKDFMKLNDSLHFSSAVIVSSFYHMTRSKYIFRKLGFRQLSTAASGEYFWNDGFGLFREFFAFYKYLLWY